jgi:hypothetical protein
MAQFLLNQRFELTELSFAKESEEKEFAFNIQKQPVFKEDKQKPYVIWGFSKDPDERKWNNRLPDYYEWLYDSSSKNRAIIDTKVDYVTGKGLETNEQGLDTQQKIELKSFAFKINDSGLIRKLNQNRFKLGGFCFEVIFDERGKKITPHYVNLKNLRISKCEYDGNGQELPRVYYYTEKWSASKPELNPDWKEFHEFEWTTDGYQKSKRYIVVFQEDEETTYPIPEYTAAIPYIASDYEVGNFVYNNTKNGFTSGWLINFYNGEPQEDQKEQIVNAVKDRFTGSDNSGEPLVAFNEISQKGVEVLPISPNGQDDRFINLNKQIREEVYSGHKISPIIVGLPGDGGWSNNADEKRTAEESFQRKWVSPRQRTIEEYMNAILVFNEVKGSVYVAPLDPSRPQFSSSEILAAATSEEKRQLLGLPKSALKANPINDAVSQLHPLVAAEAVRRIGTVDLLKMLGIEPVATVVQTTIKEFSKQEADEAFINFFSTSGIDDSELEVISSREIFAKDIDDAEAQEHKFISRAESTVLNILRQNSKATTKELSELLKITEKEVNDILDRLKNNNLLTPDNNVTVKGQEAIDESELFTVYKYTKRNDVSGSDVIETTRDFCRRMVMLSRNRSWTLNEIKAMSNGTGLDVFRSRGGWYTLPGTDVHTPYCRHIWQAVLVRRKSS